MFLPRKLQRPFWTKMKVSGFEHGICESELKTNMHQEIIFEQIMEPSPVWTRNCAWYHHFIHCQLVILAASPPVKQITTFFTILTPSSCIYQHQSWCNQQWNILYDETFLRYVIVTRWVGKKILVGGFNPFEKYESKWESSPNRGENKKYLKPPPSKILSSPSLTTFANKLVVFWSLSAWETLRTRFANRWVVSFPPIWSFAQTKFGVDFFPK